jgi:hypothetical protein
MMFTVAEITSSTLKLGTVILENVLLWKDLYVVAVELRVIHVNFLSSLRLS